MAFDLLNRALRLLDLAAAQLIAHRLRHVAAHEEQQHRRDHPDHEQRAPTEVGHDRQTESGGDHEPDWKRRHHGPGHAATDAAGAEFRRQGQGDRDFTAETEVRQEPEGGERQDVPGCGDEACKEREDADRREKRRAAPDVIGNRSPEQRAGECADETDGCKPSSLCGAKPELAGDRRQRGAEQREIGGIEHDAKEGQYEEITVPAREWEPLEAPDQLSRLPGGTVHGRPP